MRRLISAMMLGLSVSLIAPIAYAEPTASERETARTLLLSGRDKKKNGQLKEALADFEKAHGIMRVPTTGLDLGKAQKDLGLLVEARATLLEAARHPEKSNEPRAFKRARQEAKQLADEIAPKLATLTLTVSAGARVKMDDADLSASSIGAPLKMNPGKHEITASLNGEQKKTNVDLGEGESKSIEVLISGVPAGPPESGSNPPKEKEKEKEKEKDPTPKKTQLEARTNPLVWVGVATAVVGVGVGATTGIMAFGVKNDVASRCVNQTQCPPSTYADIDSGESLATISTVGFIVGLIGGGILVYGLLNPTQVEVPASSSASSSSSSASRSLLTTERRHTRPTFSFSPFGVAGTF